MKKFFLLLWLLPLFTIASCNKEDLPEITFTYTTSNGKAITLGVAPMIKVISNNYENGVGTLIVKPKISTISWDNLFCDNKTLTSIIIPEGETEIGSGAFNDCISLVDVIMPQGLIEIGSSAFSGCISLKTITIPSSIVKIGMFAFDSCSNLSIVYCNPSIPPQLGLGLSSAAFDNNASGRKIYVPKASVNAYKSDSGWSIYAAAIEGK